MDMGNRELILKAQHGDMFAFESLVERHRDSVYTFGLRMTKSETVASEIAQESFLSAYLHLNEFRTEAEFATWVHLIAASHASLRLRIPRSSRAAEGQLEIPKFHSRGAQHPSADWSANVDERRLSGELRRAIEDATAKLPHRHRELFLLKDVAGLGYEQIAQICGDSIAAIKRRLHLARLSLREAIDRFYNTRSIAA